MSNKISANRIRAWNRSGVLRMLRDEGPLPRSELALALDLSATTITKVVGDLLSEGLVVETGAKRAEDTRIGRPAIDVALVPRARVVCGVQVGVGIAHLAVCDLFAQVLDETSVEFDPVAPVDAVLDVIVAGLSSLLGAADVLRDSVIGIGVATPGPVDRIQRMNLLSINLGWRDVPFSDRFEAALGIPTVVDHNVRAMALAEARYGQAWGRESVAFVYVRTGVGAGLVMDGHPYRGGTHGATELGHMRVVAGEDRCACGSRGCLETVASEAAMAEGARAVAAGDPGGPLARELAAGTAPVPALLAAARANDPAALSVLDGVAGHLATGLGNLINLLNPELVVLGGLCADAGEVFLGPLRASLRDQMFPLLRDSTQVAPTSFGRQVGVVGAAAVALDHYFYDEVPASTHGAGMRAVPPQDRVPIEKGAVRR